jgi:putative protease
MATKKEPKPIGEVTHYYGNIEVAIVKFSKPVKVGITVRFKGATTDFTQTIDSMQFEHEQIKEAKKGQQVGIKVKDTVHEGNEVYLEE